MLYELTAYEWIAIKPMLPNKPRAIPRVNDRRVLNGISGLPLDVCLACGAGSILLVDRGYDADWTGEIAVRKGRGPTSLRGAIATSQSASVPSST